MTREQSIASVLRSDMQTNAMLFAHVLAHSYELLHQSDDPLATWVCDVLDTTRVIESAPPKHDAFIECMPVHHPDYLEYWGEAIPFKFRGPETELRKYVIQSFVIAPKQPLRTLDWSTVNAPLILPGADPFIIAPVLPGGRVCIENPLRKAYKDAIGLFEASVIRADLWESKIGYQHDRKEIARMVPQIFDEINRQVAAFTIELRHLLQIQTPSMPDLDMNTLAALDLPYLAVPLHRWMRVLRLYADSGEVSVPGIDAGV
jgi:hypothetical protein